MPQLHIYNLEEFTEQNHIPDIFGSAVVCFTARREMLHRLTQPGVMPSFFTIILMIDGREEYAINNNKVELEMHDLFVKLPYSRLQFKDCSNEVESVHLLVEKNFFDELVRQNEQLQTATPLEIFDTIPVFHLSETKAAEFYDLFRHIQKTISQPHLYKQELVRYQLSFCQLLLAELVSGHEVNTHDLKHKDDILKIFLHLASRHFRKERQLQFYADRLNISSTYLSRIVKELTGNTVLGYLSNFLFNEICIQLKTTDKTMSEIAEELNFNDQSALTNFFRSKAGMSPLSYRKKSSVRKTESSTSRQTAPQQSPV